jgi:hypothetical protein
VTGPPYKAISKRMPSNCNPKVFGCGRFEKEAEEEVERKSLKRKMEQDGCEHIERQWSTLAKANEWGMRTKV